MRHGGAGGIAGGVLLSAGAASLIGGYVTEASGGSFAAGWAGGATETFYDLTSYLFGLFSRLISKF